MEIKSKLDELDLHSENAVVIGSGILSALNLRESKDIDVVVTEDRPIFQTAHMCRASQLINRRTCSFQRVDGEAGEDLGYYYTDTSQISEFVIVPDLSGALPPPLCGRCPAIPYILSNSGLF